MTGGRRLFLFFFWISLMASMVELISFKSDDAIVWILSGNPEGETEKDLEAQFSRLTNSVSSVVQNLLTPFKKTSSEVSLLIFYAHTNFSATIATRNWQTKLRGIDAAIKFVDVSAHPSFQTPEWRARDLPGAKYGVCGYEKWPEKDLFLNAFRLNGFIEHEALDQFEYVLQIDPDTSIEKTMPFDPFKRIRELNGTFAYHECTLEFAVDCVEGLPEAIGRFVRKHRIIPEHLSELNPRTSYLLNFGLFKMSDWRNPKLRLLSQTLVVREQGVHRDHWKDQNIIALLLGVFFKKEQVLNWPELSFDKIIVEAPKKWKQRESAKGEATILSNEENTMCKKNFGCLCSADQRRVGHQWDTVLSPFRSAVVTYALDNRVVSGIRVLYHSLLNTGSLENSLFVVLDFGLPWQSRNLLRSEGILVDFSHANKNLTTTHTFNETRYKDVQWRMFTKLNVFGFDYLDRVVYLDADTFALRSIAPFLDKSITKAVAATPELPEHAPEFNGGTIVIDPSAELLDDMILHLNDKYKCGIRAEDQSFLCHYFYNKWTSLGPYFQLHYWNYKWKPSLLEESYIMHFIYCPKPWDDDAIDDEFFGKWNAVAATLHPPVSVNSIPEWSFL